MIEKTPKNYSPIKNNIADALALMSMSGYEWQIVMATIRKTYGWQNKDGSRKTEDYIALSQYNLLTGIKESHVSRTLKLLLSRNILTKRGKLYGINKQTEEWIKNLPKGVNTHNSKNLPKGVNELTKRGNKNLPKGGDTKEKKETYTKEITTNVVSDKSRGNAELNDLISYSGKLDFVIQGTNIENRRSAYNLLKKYGLEQSKRLLLASVSARGKSYSPSISDFTQLYRKVGDLAMYYKKTKGEQNEFRNFDN